MADQTQTLDFDFSNLDADQTLDALIEIRQTIGWLQARDKGLLARLDELAAAGEVDQGGFKHEDWLFSWSAGKRSYSYPAPVQEQEKQLKVAKDAAKADGTATVSTGNAFWSITPTKQ
jgi:hypothetical protein